MPRMTVHMFGIMYFHLPEGKPAMVLLPDARAGEEHIPPHHASLFVERSRCRTFKDWKPIEREVPVVTDSGDVMMVPVLEFRLSRFSQITFPPDHQTSPADVTTLRQGLVHMRDVDPDFRPDLENSKKKTIAQVKIESGILKAFRFNRNLDMVQWSIRTGNKPLTITTDEGSVEMHPQIHSEFGSEVVLTNSHDVLAAHEAGRTRPAASEAGRPRSPHDGSGDASGAHIHHFKLFGKLDLSHGTPQFPQFRTNARYACSMMSFFNRAAYDSSCTPPCC